MLNGKVAKLIDMVELDQNIGKIYLIKENQCFNLYILIYFSSQR